MNCYCVISHFRENLPEDIDIQEITQQHHDYLENKAKLGMVVMAGPHVWDDGSVGKGGVIILKAESKQAAEEVMQNDPFAINKITNYTIYEYIVKNACSELGDLIK